MDHFNKLTPGEHERLSCLMEEMAEASQIIGKILRHGYESRNPFNDEGTNREMLERELGHVRCRMLQMCMHEDLSKDAIHESARLKTSLGNNFLHHKEPLYCDDCFYLTCTEEEQDQVKKMTDKRPSHLCLQHSVVLTHMGKHPRLPRPVYCTEYKKSDV